MGSVWLLSVQPQQSITLATKGLRFQPDDGLASTQVRILCAIAAITRGFALLSLATPRPFRSVPGESS